ncbi:DUF1573 domain-containing protein [Crocinitomix sp.]|nr:DUF1573 domain-containing protein [Crocinitomix sp.]
MNSPLQDLGDIFENSGKVNAKFILENPYRVDTIRILNIETSCGCTAVLTKDTLILPRSSIELEVSYDPSGRLGLFVKSIELSTKTGRDERNMLYLKIMGNVVAENYSVQKVDRELISYSVAPIYFYPITAYDTSYLDFNFITNFVNDLTYEIDFYQFTTVGAEVEVRSYSEIQKMENLITYAQKKVNREFTRRGFSVDQVFFDEPIFKLSTDLPGWSSASICLYSSNFDAIDADSSDIKVTSTETVNRTKMLLDYQRFALPEIEEILKEVNFESIEGKLFLNGGLALRGMILMPWKKGNKLQRKTAKELEKAIQKQIKQSTGAGKKVVSIKIDSLGIHPADKYHFILWDEADVDQEGNLKYQFKPDDITPPLLPTYKQLYTNGHVLDTASAAFNHFWTNILLNQKAGRKIEFLIESSLSRQPKDFEMGNLEIASNYGETIANFLTTKFLAETGDTLQVKVKSLLHGPNTENYRKQILEIEEFEYVNIIPILNNQPNANLKISNPYMVNFDYYFNGIDVGAWGFQRFANYLSQAVMSDGYVELRIESSISKVPVENNMGNVALAYSRLNESVRRLKEEMARKLIDPNRIIILEERALEQGPIYDGSMPILYYRKYHYIRIIPEKSLNK